MGEERNISCHLVIGPLIVLCELDHLIQSQNIVVHLANKSAWREEERQEKGRREREEKEREKTRRRK